jgi:hypothetical protein
MSQNTEVVDSKLYKEQGKYFEQKSDKIFLKRANQPTIISIE